MLQEMSGTQKITIGDHQHINGITAKSENYVVNLESLSNGLEKEATAHPTNSSTTTTNSRITLQRNLSRKGVQRGGERKINDRDMLAPSSSPREAQVLSTSEKPISPTTKPMVPADHSPNNQVPQHQITIKTGSITTVADGRWWGKRSSFKRSPPSWFSDPKRILLFFATLSSMGTILLIYFTLSMSKQNGEEGTSDWQ